jgi:hypothetical protein
MKAKIYVIYNKLQLKLKYIIYNKYIINYNES